MDTKSKPDLEAIEERAEARAEQIIAERAAKKERDRLDKLVESNADGLAEIKVALLELKGRFDSTESAGEDLAKAVETGQISGKVQGKIVAYGTSIAGGVYGIIEMFKAWG